MTRARNNNFCKNLSARSLLCDAYCSDNLRVIPSMLFNIVNILPLWSSAPTSWISWSVKAAICSVRAIYSSAASNTWARLSRIYRSEYAALSSMTPRAYDIYQVDLVFIGPITYIWANATGRVVCRLLASIYACFAFETCQSVQYNSLSTLREKYGIVSSTFVASSFCTGLIWTRFLCHMAGLLRIFLRWFLVRKCWHSMRCLNFKLTQLWF